MASEMKDPGLRLRGAGRMSSVDAGTAFAHSLARREPLPACGGSASGGAAALTRVLAATIVLLAPCPTPGQVRTRITGDACEECRITADRVLTVGDEGSGAIAELKEVSRAPDGRILVVHFADFAGVSVFGPTGTFVHRIGGRGGGPGEYQFIGNVQVDSVGRIHIWDPGSLRMTVLGRDYRVQETIPFALPFMHVLFDGGRYVASGTIRTRELAGYTLHSIDASGQLLKSFSPQGEGYRSDRSDTYRRSIALSGSRMLWSARFTEYVLESFGTDGIPVQVLERVVPWFPAGTNFGAPRGDPTARPSPGVLDIQIDDKGRIWVLSWVADKNWRRGLKTLPGLYGRATTGTPMADRWQYWDSVIEVIDPGAGALIAAGRFDELFIGLADANHAFAYREDESGHPFMDLYRLNAATPRSGGAR